MATGEASSPQRVKVFLLEFSTRSFDLAAERENDINPIHGESFLWWLRPRLEPFGFRATEPDTEDWGWYVDVEGESGRYLVGAQASAGNSEGVSDWMVQLHRLRTLREWLLRRGHLTRDDPLMLRMEQLVREEPAFDGLAVSPG